MRGPNTTYLPGIDHLRAFAATLIVFYHGLHLISQQRLYGHFDFNQWMHASNPFSAFLIEGHTAVALFMTLSGFIFTAASLDKDLRYAPFIRNRFLRIYPLFIAILAVGLYATAAKAEFGSIAASVLFLANTPGALQAPPFTAMFWTIAVEFQFYLIFPFLLRFVQRDGPSILLKIILFFVLMRTAAVFAGANSRDLPYLTIVGRIDQFCIGMGCAWLYLRRRTWLRYPELQLLMSGVAVLLCFWLFNAAGGWPTVTWWKIVFHSVEALLWGHFILCYLLVSWRIPQMVSRALCYVGSISYSTYLLHFPFISVVIHRHWLLTMSSDPAMDALANTLIFIWPAMLLLSTVSYYAIELPFLNLRQPYLTERSSDQSSAAEGVERKPVGRAGSSR